MYLWGFLVEHLLFKGGKESFFLCKKINISIAFGKFQGGRKVLIFYILFHIL
jgi:hypothetical protein